MKAKTKRYLLIVAGFICALSLFLGIGLWQSEAPVLSADAERYDVTSTSSTLSPGVVETTYITNDAPGNNDQVITYAVEVDLQQSTLIAGYKDYNTEGKWGMQTVRDQAAAAESARGVNIVAAVNADFYNMGTGQPSGVLVMNGKQVNTPAGRNYFAILKDGSAVIRNGALQGDEQEAVGGDVWFVHNGQVVTDGGVYYTQKNPRTAVGIKADGTVVIVVADGRQAPVSSGYTLTELATKMVELGCVEAINLDGGGSTTYLSKQPGTNELALTSSPADGQERSVSSSLFVVSMAEATGVFDSAVISPTNEVYTPGSVVDFTAIGADTAGFAVDIPDGAEWRVAESSTVKGEITAIAAEEGVQAAASFVSEEGATGTATIEMVYQGEVVGTASIELQWPDTLTMENSQFSLDFSEETGFGLSAFWQTREVHLKPGDLTWVIGDTGNEEFPSIGVMNGDIFVADAEATNVTATVTAKLVHDTSVTVSAEVSVGQLPYVFMDFEDIENEDGTITKAEDYYTFGTDGNFMISTVGKGEIGSAQIVDTSTGEVRVGQKALQINYDFTQAQREATLGIYFGTSSYVRVPQMGMPTAIGVWIYVPTDGFNFWLRTWFKGYDENGEAVGGNSFSGGFGANFNANDGVALEQGWNYITADLSQANSFGPSYYEFGDQIFRIMLVGPSGTYTAGHIYLDNFQLEYGPNTDDIFAPEINQVSLYNESGIALEDGVTISDDPFSIYASYEEFTGLSDEELAEIEDESLRERYEKASMYATGVNEENVHVYVDGNEVDLTIASQNYLSTSSISLPNGKHNITVEVYDNFQNVATKSFVINVANESDYAAVVLTPETAAPYLGSPYVLDLSADSLADVQNVTFEIRLAAGLSLTSENITDIAAGFSVTECELIHVNNNIYRVTIARNEEEMVPGETLLAKLNINIPTTLIEGSQLTYSIVSSEVTYSDPAFQSEIINSFYDGNTGTDVQSYYTISADVMIVGSAGGNIYVTDPDGAPAAGVTVTVDGEYIGTTDSEGKIFTYSFIGEACSKVVAAYSDLGYSFGQTVYGVLPGGTAEKADPALVRSVATENGNTEQRIVWLSNPLYAAETATVKYATLADYEADGEAAFKTVVGESMLVEFTGTYAVYVNQVLITGLEEDTEYVYVAGDGTVWSATNNFSTSKQHGETNFFVIGDTQENNPGAIEAYTNAINGSNINYDFAIQTGDFVDNGGNYTLWNNIISLFSGLSSTDFVQVFGNHEYEGNTDGLYPDAMNFVPNKDYYSVTYGNVYVAVINIYTESGLNEAMEWIKEDAAKSDAVWKVLTMHRPPYYTNISGGSETAHELIPAFVDEVGFDVVFSGHDHSYARTQPMTGGEVDKENGAVYYIVGAAESGRYGVVDNPEFNFAYINKDFNAVYLSVSASYTELTITAYDMQADGTFAIFDEYIIRNSCYPDEHEYEYDHDSGMLVCTNCYYEVAPADINFSGFIQDTDGETMYFALGAYQTGWIPLGTDYYYFDEDGIGVNGEVTLTSDYAGQQAGDITFVFENGLKVGGHTGWYGEKYYDNGTFVTGWIDLDGDYYYLATGNDVGRNPGVSIGDKLKGGRRAVYTPTSPYFTIYYIYFDADGKYMHGDFHERGDNGSGQWAYTYVRVPSDPDGVWVNYCWDRWVETEYGMFYVQYNTIITRGEAVIDGVRYRFADEGTADPRTSGNGVLLGRYYDVEFVSQGTTISSSEMFEGDKITAPAAPEAPAGNSIKSYTFAGWYNGDVAFADDVVTQDVTYTAKFDAVYTERYNEIADALEVLETAEELADKRAALYDVQELYNGLTAEEIADCEAEGLSFDTYRELLGELCTVTFVANNRVVFTANVLSGETVNAPATPAAPAGNSIKSYVFGGWFSGSTQFMSGAVTRGGTYTARFDTVYTSTYSSVAGALAVLNRAQTPSAQREAIEDLQPLYEALTERELADCEAEGLDFSLYRELVDDFCTVTFVVDGENVLTVTILPGETVAAPAAPEVPAGNSIKTYTFAGWFSGDTAHTPELAITAGMTFEAVFDAVYTDNYTQLSEALSALEGAEGGTLSARYEALTAVYNARAAMTETELADSEAEGLSFALYDEMLADYNSVADGAKEDLDTATDAAAAIIGAVTAVAAAAAVAGFCIKRR